LDTQQAVNVHGLIGGGDGNGSAGIMVRFVTMFVILLSTSKIMKNPQGIPVEIVARRSEYATVTVFSLMVE